MHAAAHRPGTPCMATWCRTPVVQTCDSWREALSPTEQAQTYMLACAVSLYEITEGLIWNQGLEVASIAFLEKTLYRMDVSTILGRAGCAGAYVALSGSARHLCSTTCKEAPGKTSEMN